MDKGCSGGVLCPGIHKCLRGWGPKPSCLTSNPFYRFNLSVKFFLLLEDPIKESWLGGGGGRGAELNIHKSKIKYQAAKLLSFLNLQMLKMIYFSFVIVH